VKQTAKNKTNNLVYNGLRNKMISYFTAVLGK